MKTIITTIVLGTLASSSLALAADNTSNIRSFFSQKQSLHENVPETVRTALDACHTEHENDRGAMKTCADAVFEANGIEKPMHRGFGGKHGMMPELSEAVRTALDACHTEHENDRGAMKTCADAVFEANGIEKPMHRGFGGKHGMMPELSEAVRTALDSCHIEHDGDRGAMKTCADAVFEANGIEKPMHRSFGGKHGMMPELSETVRTALDVCHTEHENDREAMKTCADAIFEANGIEKPMFNKTNQQ